jgi:hypothetical protein
MGGNDGWEGEEGIYINKYLRTWGTIVWCRAHVTPPTQGLNQCDILNYSTWPRIFAGYLTSQVDGICVPPPYCLPALVAGAI